MVLTQWKRVYKLTDENGQTQNGCQWGRGVTNPHGVLSGRGGPCSSGFYHGYATAELAAFLNPIHAKFKKPRLWVAEIRGTTIEDGSLKLGATQMRTVREIPVLTPTTEQRVAFAIYAAGSTLAESGVNIPKWAEWADGWLNGERNADAAYAATYAANTTYAAYAAYAATNAATHAATHAANAIYAAYAATYATYAANANAELLQDAAVFALQFTP